MLKTVSAVAVAAALLAPTIAQAQEEPRAAHTDRHTLAQTAGYRALYTCTATFLANISQDRLEADIFANYDSRGRVTQKDVTVDHANKRVLVRYLDDMPPRIAVWRPLLGCVQLPIGTSPDVAFPLPTAPEGLQTPDYTQRDWPLGDRNAVARIPARQKAALDAVVARAFDGTYGGVTWAVIVVKDGKIIAERYDRGYDMHTPQRTNSAAKSMAATLVGIAQKKGLVDIMKPGVLAEWRRPGDPRGAITLNDLLHMSSGLYTEASGNPQQELYRSGASAAERSALNVMDSKPGTRWVYAGSDTILSVRAIRQAINDDKAFLAWPFQELFWKIGMTHTTPETDWTGDFLMSGQLWSTARDFARFGLLYINDGVWQGERILPEGWAKYVATPAPDQPKGRDGRGYGAQFWLFGPKQGLPEGSYTPAGARGQYAMIVPSKGVIVVRRGFDKNNEAFEIPRFTADVLKVLDGEGSK